MWRLHGPFKERLLPRLQRLYPEEDQERLLERLALIMGRYNFLQDRCSVDTPCWNEGSCLLVTYGDMVTRAGEAPLRTLHRFLDDHFRDLVAGVHILPFFPYSSDDGFSVIDYRQVDPRLGGWEDIRHIAAAYHLMVDLVLNHVSSRSSWFEAYLGGVAPQRHYFIEVDPDTDLSKVVRPRTTPLLTPVDTVYGRRWVWTTFSSDQVDLNYHNPNVLLEMVDVLLEYVAHGARILRLDAIAYLWKEIGTSCLNLWQTHEVVKVFRDIVDHLCPSVLLLTETNLPHEENVSYFGEGDEAHMVYQFSLPPLLLHAIHSGDASVLSQWAADLAPTPPGCTFLNFTASHDGIGVRPLEGLVDPETVDWLAARCQALGGLVSSRTGPEGQELVYELNITYFDAMGDPDRPGDLDWQIRRFLCSQAVMLALRGVPAIYFHSLVGGRNDHDGARESGIARRINRARYDDESLRRSLADPASIPARVLAGYRHLLQVRRGCGAFHPDAVQEVLSGPREVFALLRRGTVGERVLCLHNLSARPVTLRPDDLGAPTGHGRLQNLLTGHMVAGDEAITLEPYQYAWLRPAGE